MTVESRNFEQQLEEAHNNRHRLVLPPTLHEYGVDRDFHDVSTLNPRQLEIRRRMGEIMMQDLQTAFPYFDPNKMHGKITEVHESGFHLFRAITRAVHDDSRHKFEGPVWIAQVFSTGIRSETQGGPNTFDTLHYEDVRVGTCITPNGTPLSFYEEAGVGSATSVMEFPYTDCDPKEPFIIPAAAVPNELPEDLYGPHGPITLVRWRSDLLKLV